MTRKNSPRNSIESIRAAQDIRPVILKLLHEPRFRIMKTDPISGHDVDNYLDHCSLIDGNLMIYFDREEHRKTFKAMPFNHPDLRLPYPVSNNDGRGG
jgi:YHS domain-containing protein